MPTRAFLHAHNTLAGRLLLGPARCLWLFYKGEIARLLRGDTRHAAAWGLHAAGVALVLLWVIAVCGLPLGQYLLLFVYPGIALSLVRSFPEHQAPPEARERTVIVRNSDGRRVGKACVSTC